VEQSTGYIASRSLWASALAAGLDSAVVRCHAELDGVFLIYRTSRRRRLSAGPTAPLTSICR
jgi:hypothetical protein